MPSPFQFRIMTEDEARRIQAPDYPKHGDTMGDRLRAQRRLLPVVTDAERKQSQTFNRKRKKSR